MPFSSRSWRRGAAPAGTHAVAENAVLRLPGGRGAAVRVQAGRVVVTRAGDPEDHVLEAGQELALAGSTRALAWALAPSRIEVRVASVEGALAPQQAAPPLPAR